ncbi:unnamed protein product, partial [Ectocarpus sp. 4 AP-2014]
PSAAAPIVTPPSLDHTPVTTAVNAVTFAATATAVTVKARKQSVFDVAVKRQALRAAQPHQDPRRIIAARRRSRVRGLAGGAGWRGRWQELRGRRQDLGTVGPRRSVRGRRDVGHAAEVVVVVVHDPALPDRPHRRAQAPALPAAAEGVRMVVVLRPPLVREKRLAFPLAAAPGRGATDIAAATASAAPAAGGSHSHNNPSVFADASARLYVP